MKKSLFFMVIAVLLISSVPAFSQFLAGAEYFNFEYEDNSAGMFGGFLGYNMGDWELQVSYYMWDYSETIDYGLGTIDYTLQLRPMHLQAIYKFSLPSAEGWMPFVGLGYGQTDFSIEGYEDDSEKYDSWLWMVGVRYYFNRQFAAFVKYMQTEVDVEGNTVNGSGFGFGAMYEF